MEKIFTEEDKRKEAFLRASNAIYSYWRVTDKESRIKLECRIHTRILEILISDSFVTLGESVNGKGHREHIVPLVMIIDESIKMFNKNYLTEDVAQMIENNLIIIHITKDEQKYLDFELGYKKTMPEEWKFGDDPYARLKKALIEIKFY